MGGTIKKGASTDPKKHFEVINFILSHFVNFLEEIYQEKILDVSSPLKEETFAVQENRKIFSFRGNKLSRMTSYEKFRGNKLSR